MTDSIVVYTDLSESLEAGSFLGAKVLADFEEHSPDALIVFASSRHGYTQLLRTIKAACNPKVIAKPVEAVEDDDHLANLAGRGAKQKTEVSEKQQVRSQKSV